MGWDALVQVVGVGRGRTVGVVRARRKRVGGGRPSERGVRGYALVAPETRGDGQRARAWGAWWRGVEGGTPRGSGGRTQSAVGTAAEGGGGDPWRAVAVTRRGRRR